MPIQYTGSAVKMIRLLICCNFVSIQLNAHLQEEIQLLISPKRSIAAIEKYFTEITVYGNKILWGICLNSQESCEESQVSPLVYVVVGSTAITSQLLEHGDQKQQLVEVPTETRK